MELRCGRKGAVFLLLCALMALQILAAEGTMPLVLKAGETPASALEAVSDTLDLLKQRMGWKADEVELASIDTRDARIGQTLIYEFDIQVGSVVIPLRLSEEVTTWQYLEELPASGSDSEDGEEGGRSEATKKQGAVHVWRPEAFAATLSPFEVAGPVDLWIQDAEELRLAMPHDVDAGVLKRVLLADGAAVSVQGAREVSLSRPLQLPLPLTGGGPEGGLAASLVALAARLRSASRGEEKPLLSLRIVSPTSLTAVKTPAESSGGRLKVKRLGSGAIELTSPESKKTEPKHMTVPYGTLALTENVEDFYMWPLPSINKTKLAGLEEALVKTLGARAYKRGSFQLLKAKVAAASFVQIGFEVEKAVAKEAFEDEELWPEWATKPTVERLQFELLTKVEGRKLMPVRVQQSEPVLPTIAISPNVADGNFTMSATQFLMPPGAMTLDVDLDGIVD